MNMKTEVGKYYINERGEKIGPMEYTRSGDWYEYWAPNKGYFSDAGESQSRIGQDLISEWADEPADAADGEWGPWIGWNGGECPVAGGITVDVRTWSGCGRTYRADKMNWDDDTAQNHVIAYRVRKDTVVDTVTMALKTNKINKWVGTDLRQNFVGEDHRITFNTHDGIPQWDTLRGGSA